MIQDGLKQLSSHSSTISEVKPFGRAGIVYRTSNLDSVSDLLKCSSFSRVPVKAFPPFNLCCTKGVVKGIGPSAGAAELLDQFKGLGVFPVYRCSVAKNNQRIPTQLCIVTFAGSRCPNEVKLFPRVFRVDPFKGKPVQCKNCQRSGHSECNSPLPDVDSVE